MISKKAIRITLFLLSLTTAFWGSWQMAWQLHEQIGYSPIWSGTFGFPIPHHYIIGFIGIVLVYVWDTFDDWLEGINRDLRELLGMGFRTYETE